MIEVWLILPIWFIGWLGGVGIGYAVRGMIERRKEEKALEEMRRILKR